MVMWASLVKVVAAGLRDPRATRTLRRSFVPGLVCGKAGVCYTFRPMTRGGWFLE